MGEQKIKLGILKNTVRNTRCVEGFVNIVIDFLKDFNIAKCDFLL